MSSMKAKHDSEFCLVDADGERPYRVLTSSSNKWLMLDVMQSGFASPPPSGTPRNNGKSSFGIVPEKSYRTLIVGNIKLLSWASVKFGSVAVTILIHFDQKA